MIKIGKVLFIVFFTLLFSCKLHGQTLGFDSNSLAGSKGRIPFWLWANQLGRYNQHNKSTQRWGFSGDYNKQINPNLSIETGADLDFILSGGAELRFTQLFGAAQWKALNLQLGLFADKEVYGGLSSTNGNLSSSLNARPHPRVRLSLNKFVALTQWLSIYAFYEEGLLNDSRYVYRTHLHRKALYFRVGKPSSLRFTAGLEHFVMWGGTHPVYGELQGWEMYFDYVLGGKGDENSLMTDQMNVVGNGYGSFQFELYKNWGHAKTTLYLSHPFDDHSGMEWDNYKDNLIGIFIDINKASPFIKNIAVEYFYTKNQSGKYHLDEAPEGTKHRRGRDDYYNHGVYKSGVTYCRMAMCSPLFAPINTSNGISTGFDNTRIAGFHVAANGFLSKTLQWKSMITYSNNFGRYNRKGETSYVPSLKMLSSLVQLKYQTQKIPLSVAVSVAADHGSLYDQGTITNRLGGMISVHYQIFD